MKKFRIQQSQWNEEFEVVGLDVAKQRTVYVIFTYIYKDGEEEELSVIKIVRNKKEFKKFIKKYKSKYKIKKINILNMKSTI